MSNRLTGLDLCAGGGLLSWGMRAAGIKHLRGLEIDPRIAAVAELNGFKTIVADICNVDFKALRRALKSTRPLFWLHSSPPCIGASNANPLQGEGSIDINIAEAIVRAIKVFMPEFFTLENVVHYASFRAFGLILNALQNQGYEVEFSTVNMANFGVPQTRRRLILIARRDRALALPFPTHSKNGDMFTDPWVGWYEAIEGRGLIPQLEEAQFSAYQIKCMKSHGFDPFRWVGFIADVRHSKRKGTIRFIQQPSFTIVASQWKGHIKGRLPCGKIFKTNQAVYAALQSVPVEYRFGKSKMINQRIIGNGVPPLFAEKLARHLVSLAEKGLK